MTTTPQHERHRGVYALLHWPWVYETFQRMVGNYAAYRRYWRDFIVPSIPTGTPDITVIDLGCGPATWLRYWPKKDVPVLNYIGLDINALCVDQARSHWGKHFAKNPRVRCRFELLTPDHPIPKLPQADWVTMIGLLHHVDDHTARSVMTLAKVLLKPEGRLLTVDSCLRSGQSWLANWLVRHDRGQYVRTAEQFQTLVQTQFPSVGYARWHEDWLRIPFTLWVMQAGH